MKKQFRMITLFFALIILSGCTGTPTATCGTGYSFNKDGVCVSDDIVTPLTCDAGYELVDGTCEEIVAFSFDFVPETIEDKTGTRINKIR